MKFSTKTTGFEGLEDALIELEQFSGRTTAGKNAVQRGMKKALKRIEDGMWRRAPYDPLDLDEDGQHLRDTMKTQKVKAKRKRGSAKFERQTGVEMMTGPAPRGTRARSNASWQEDGTVKMTPHPYARPTADAEGPAVLRDVAKELQDAIGKSVARARKKAARGK